MQEPIGQETQSVNGGTQNFARAAAPLLRRMGRTRFMVPYPAFDWYIGRISAAAVVVTTCFGVMAWWYQQQYVGAIGLDLSMAEGDMLGRFSRVTLLAQVVAILCSSIMMILASMFLLHRILGPVYRLKSHMISILEGNPPNELKLRDDDQLVDLSETYNNLLYMLDALESKPLVDADRAGESPPS